MRYAGNNTNLARTGALTGTNAVASAAIYRTDTAAKTGGGLALVTGPYTGAADTDIDVEIVDLLGSTPQVSAPAFSGVGNGSMTGLATSGLAAQTITVTLEDLGTETRKAYAPFQGVTLRAKTAPGNGITISISQAGITRTATDFSLQEDVSKGVNEYEGTHWDISALGGMTLEPDGKVPTTAPRVMFGADPQVYVAFRKYKDGRYVYGFSPSPVRDVARGTRIYQVTGTRTMTITDGVSPETHTGCGSLYQALASIRDTSVLVEVDGPVVNDRLPGGQAVVDLSVWTASYVIGIDPDGSYACLKAELQVTPATTAPTEQVTIQCISSGAIGGETWRVDSDVSGRLANATTAVTYSDGPYAFTIPAPQIEGGQPSNTTGNIAFSYEPQTRENNLLPTVSVYRPVLGAAAKNGVYEFTWTKRPEPGCSEEGQVIGSPNADCLGINPPGDENVSDASRLRRLQRLTAAVRNHVGSNTAPFGHSSDADIAAIEKGASILASGLAKLAGGTTAWPSWEASTDYAVDEVAEPVVRNGYRYAVTTAGTTGATEPTWGTTVDGTTNDGTVVWTNIGLAAFGMWDAVFDQWNNEAAMLAGAGSNDTAQTWTTLTEGVVGGLLVPSTRNGCVYQSIITRRVTPSSVDEPSNFAYHGVDEPGWPTDENGGAASRIARAFADSNTTDWRLAWRYWGARRQYAVGAIARPGNGRTYKVTTAGVSDTTEPTWPTTSGGTVSDGTVTWTEFSAVDVAIAPTDAFFERYVTAMTDCLAAAGISVNFEFASVDGDGCWQDHGDEGYWQSTDGYLPVFNNVYYHSSRQYIDENGEPYNQSTQEFGFGIAVGCVNLLQYGDKCYLTISDVAGSSTGQGYQEGDTFTVAVQNAVPVPFGGGQTGDDTLTWSVRLGTDGRITDYALVTTAPAAYAYSSGGDTVDFLIAPGGIPFALGDTFVAEIEGGRFKWRRDGGAWSSAIDIATTALADGLSVQFSGGVAPSWAAGDRWSYRAEATHGAVQMRTPIDGEFEWTGSTVIEVEGGAISGVGIYAHRIADGATITLTGSDDNFATTPLSQVITWRRGNIWQAVTANRAKYRISISTSGAIRWLYLGTGTQMQIRTGAVELGRLTKRHRIASVVSPAGIGATVVHEALTETATDALLDMLNHAGEFDDFLLGIVPNDTEADTGLVRLDSDSVDIDDVFGFQPTSNTKRLQSVSLGLVAE